MNAIELRGLEKTYAAGTRALDGVSFSVVSTGIEHAWAVAYFGFMTALFFSLLGFLNGIFARKFDSR
jgi:hypothetical protein